MAPARVVVYGHRGCPGSEATLTYFERHALSSNSATSVATRLLGQTGEPSAVSQW